jgi:hypothetical protein
MTNTNLSPEELRTKIQEHFKSNGLKAELYLTLAGQTGGKIKNVKFEGIFNEARILAFYICYNQQNKLLITDFKGICPIEELTQILIELKTVIDKL